MIKVMTVCKCHTIVILGLIYQLTSLLELTLAFEWIGMTICQDICAGSMQPGSRRSFEGNVEMKTA